MRTNLLILAILVSLTPALLADDGFDIQMIEMNYRGFLQIAANDQNDNILLVYGKGNTNDQDVEIYAIYMEWTGDGSFLINDPVYLGTSNRSVVDVQLLYHSKQKEFLLLWAQYTDIYQYNLKGIRLNMDGTPSSAVLDILDPDESTVIEFAAAPVLSKIKGAPRKGAWVVSIRGYLLDGYFRPGIWTFYLDKKAKLTGKTVATVPDTRALGINDVLVQKSGLLILTYLVRYSSESANLIWTNGAGVETKRQSFDRFNTGSMGLSHLTELQNGNVLVTLHGMNPDVTWDDGILNMIMSPDGKDQSNFVMAYLDNPRTCHTVQSTDGKNVWQTYFEDSDYKFYTGTVDTKNGKVNKIVNHAMSSLWKAGYYWSPKQDVAPIGNTGKYLQVCYQLTVDSAEDYCIRGYIN